MTNDEGRMTKASLARAGVVLCAFLFLMLGIHGACAAAIRASSDPVKDERPIKPEDKEHWAFKPLQLTPGKKDIDDFAAHTSPPADPATLIRRLTFDLTGLPPTPEEVAAFSKACIQHPESSIEQLTDRLLASPRYGEHWA
jgi:hypothetical protein